MRTTFAVGRVDRKTSQVVVVAKVTRPRRWIEHSVKSAEPIRYPRGPWSVRAWVGQRSDRMH